MISGCCDRSFPWNDDMCAHPAVRGRMAVRPVSRSAVTANGKEGADTDFVPRSPRIAKCLIDDLQGPADPVRVCSDAETDPVSQPRRNGNGTGSAADHLDGNRVERQVGGPFQPAREIAEGDIFPVQVRAQKPEVTFKLLDALRALPDNCDSRISARHAADCPAAAQYLNRSNARRDDAGIAGDEVEGSAQQFDPLCRTEGIAHFAEAIRHPRVVLTEHLEVEAELL